MGYIKTEEAIEALYRYGFVTKETIEKNIREIPSIDIVRCKECRYYHQLYGCQKHDDIDLVTSDDDFCSYGERKSNE